MNTIATWLILATVAQTSVHEKNYQTREWTDLIRGGLVPYHQLRFEDFRVDDPRHNDCEAFTTGFIQYRFQCKVTGNGPFEARVSSMCVWSGLDRNQTWRRPWLLASSGFVSHEQLHLDINELTATSYAKKPIEEFPVAKGRTPEEAQRELARRVDMVFQSYMKEARRQHDRYDLETSGGKSKGPQIAWANSISDLLRRAGIRPIWRP